MNIVFALYYEDDEILLRHSTKPGYGNCLFYPFKILISQLEQLGHKVWSRKEFPLANADLAVFIDLDSQMYDLARELPDSTRKMLCAMESPIYTPLTFDANIVFNGPWDIVLTWHRGFKSSRIKHFDLPVTGTRQSSFFPPENNTNSRGVVVSSYKKDVRGNTLLRDTLFLELARNGEVDIYGKRWKKSKNIHGAIDNKIETMSAYDFAFLTENSLYPGYVTEKLGDAILAGLPSIYYGDIENAERLYPGTFVPVNELSIQSFHNAKAELLANYDQLAAKVEEAQQNSNHWTDSFINNFINAVKTLGE